MIIVITGGRHREPTYGELLDFHMVLLPYDPSTLIIRHGNCRGTDKAVGRFFANLGYIVEPFPVDHSIDGPWPEAGPRRNYRMLTTPDKVTGEMPSLVIAFIGGRGTNDCKSQARWLGVEIKDIEP
jgi:hypothetical protein